MSGCHCCGALSGIDGQGACKNCGMINAVDRIAQLTKERDAAIEALLFQANLASKAQTQVDRLLKELAECRKAGAR